MGSLPNTWREPDREIEVPLSQAIEEWAEAAIPILEDIARTYPGHISYATLLDRAMDATGVRTALHVRRVASRLLNRVIVVGNGRGLPPLTALVVHAADGMVGVGFDAVLRAAEQDVPTTDLERERAAAAARLECYRAYCDHVPHDAEPLLTPRYEARVRRPKKAEPRPRQFCPVHGLQLSAAGVCADCY